MTFTAFFRRLLLTCLVFVSAGIFSQAIAQTGGEEPAGRGAVQLTAGDVLEIMGVHPGSGAGFDWILTQKGTFMEAGRESIFRTRFTQAGTYMLDGQRTDVTGIRRLHIDIDVLPRTDNAQNHGPGGVGLNIVTTFPSGGKSGVQISRDRPLLGLLPSAALSGPISLDLDTTVDSNGDGDPENDNDGGDTLFATEHNTLYLWFSGAENAGRMYLTTTADDGTPVEQEIPVLLGAVPVPAGDIAAGPEQAGTVRFHFDLDSSIDPSDVVYQWDFGDGRGSQIDEPTHTYGLNGQYVVRLNVRELTTGRIVAQGETEFSINNIPEIAGSASSSSVSPSTGTPATTGQSGGSFSGTLIRIIIGLLAAIVLGALGVWAYMKFMHHEGRLQKMLEQVEGKLTKKDVTAPAADTIAPATMKLKRQETAAEEPAAKVSVVDAVPEKTQMKRPAPPPVVVEAAAPSWLQKGLESAKDNKTPDTPPPPSPVPVPPTPPAPEPAATPSWLQTAPTTPTPVPEVPATPAPLPPSSPPPAAPEQAPAMTEDDLLPPWLREGGGGGETKVTDTASQQNVAITASPMPAPVPAPVEAAIPPTPSPSVEPPVTPVPAPIEPAPAPVTTTPVPETPTPAPPVIINEMPAAPQPAPDSMPVPEVSMPSPAPAPIDTSAAERERERKRRKRQRYRENLKKRGQDGTAMSADTTKISTPIVPVPAPTVVPAKAPSGTATTREEKPANLPKPSTPPVQNTPKIPTQPAPVLPKPAQPSKTPAVPSPATSAKPTVPPIQKKPVPTVQPEQKKQAPMTPQKPVQKNHNHAPSPKPVVKHPAPAKPTPVPHPQKPAEKNIPKAATPPSPPAQNSDDKVAFVIKAEGIAKQKSKMQYPQQKSDAQAT